MLAWLPEDVRSQARDAYRLFEQNPNHPSRRFKRVHATRPIHSARIGLHYRARGVRDGDEIVWFRIGSHPDYDQCVSRL